MRQATAPAITGLPPVEITEEKEWRRRYRAVEAAQDFMRSLDDEEAQDLMVTAVNVCVVNPWVVLLSLPPDELEGLIGVVWGNCPGDCGGFVDNGDTVTRVKPCPYHRFDLADRRVDLCIKAAAFPPA